MKFWTKYGKHYKKIGPYENKWHLTGLMLFCCFQNSMTGTIKAPTCEIVCDRTALFAVTINSLEKEKKVNTQANSVNAKRHGWSLAFDQLPATRLEHNFMGISWKDNSCSDVSARLREMLADCWQKSCLWFCACVCSDLYKPLQGVIIQSRLFAVNINCSYYFNYIRQCFLWDFVMRFSAH